MAPRKNYAIPGVAPRRSGRIRARAGDGASTGASTPNPPQASAPPAPPPAATAAVAAATPAQPKKAPAKKKPAAKKPAAKKPAAKKTPAPKKAKTAVKKPAKAAPKTPAKSPAKSLAQTPVPIPVQTPVPVPVQAPVQTPVPIPVQMPVQTPIPIPVQTPVQTPPQKSLPPPSTGSGTGWRPSKVAKSRSSSAKSTQSGSSKVQKRLTVSQMAVLQAQFDAQQAAQQAQTQAAAAAQPHIQGQLQASAPPPANVQPPSSPTSASTAELERRHAMSSPPLESRGAFYQAQAQQAARVQARIAQQQAQAQAQAQALAQAQASAQNPPSTPTSAATSEIEARLAEQGEPRSPRRSSPRSPGRRSSGRRSPETPTPAPRIRPAPANPVSPVVNTASVPNTAGAQAATNAGAGANANANVQTSPAAAEASVNMDMSSLFPTSPVEPSPAVNSSPPGPAKVNAQLTVPFPLPAGPLIYPTPPPSAARPTSQALCQSARAPAAAAQASPARTQTQTRTQIPAAQPGVRLTMSTPTFVDVPATQDRGDADGGAAGTAGAAGTTATSSQPASVPPAVPGVTTAPAANPKPPTQLPDIQEEDDPVIETIRGTPPRQLPRATLNALLNANLQPASGTADNAGAAQRQKNQKSQKRKRRGTQSDECGGAVEEDEEDPKYPGVKKMRRPQLLVADGGRDPGNPDDDFDSSSNSSSDFEGGRGPPSETSDVMDERARIDRDFRKLPYAAQRDKLGLFMSRDDDWGEPDTDVDDDDGAGEGAPYATYEEAMRAKPDEYAGLYDYWLWEKKHNRKAPPVLKRDAKPWCPWIPAYPSVDDGEKGDWGDTPVGEDDGIVNSYQIYDEHYLNKYMVGSLFDNTAVGETTIAVGEGDRAGAEAEGDGGQEQQQEQSSSKSSLFSGSGPSFSSDSQGGQRQQAEQEDVGQEQEQEQEPEQEVVGSDSEFRDDSLLEISNAGDASTPKKKLPRKSLQWSPDVSFDDGTFDLTDAGDASTPKKFLKTPTKFPNTRRRLSQGISKKTPTRTPRKTAPVVVPTPSPLRRLAWPVYTLSSTVSSAFTGLAGWGRGPSHLSVVANVEEVKEEDDNADIGNERNVGNDNGDADFDDAEMPDADVQEGDVDIGLDEDDQFVFSAFKVRMQPEATLTQRLVQLAYRSAKTFEARGALEEGDDEQGAIVVVANHDGTIIDDTGGRFDRTTLEDHAYGDSFVDTTIHRSSTFDATQVPMSDDEVDEFDAGGDPNASVSLNLDGDVDRYDDVLKRLRVEAVPAPWAPKPKPKTKKVGPQTPQKSAQVEENENLEDGGEVDDASDPNVSASLNLDDVLERLRVEAVPAPWAPKPKTKKPAPQTPQKSSQQDDDEFQVEEQAEGEVEDDNVTDTNYVYDGTEDYTEEEEYEEDEDNEEFTVNDGVENVQSFVFAHEADNNVVDDSQMFDEQDHADNEGDVDKYDDVFVNGPIPKSAIPLNKPAAKPVNKLIEALRAGRGSSLKQSPKQSPKTKTAGAKTPLATVTAPEKTPPTDQGQKQNARTQTSAAPRRVIHHNLNRHDLDSAINRVSAMRNDLADVMSGYDNLILDKKDFMNSLEAIYLTFDGLEKNLQYWKAGVGN